MSFGKVGRGVVQGVFDGGDIVSDGEVMLVREVDRRLGLTKAAAGVFTDDRRAVSVHDILAQRVYALCCGWEDVSDHNELRGDVLLQTAVGRVEALASGPTLSRLETAATPSTESVVHQSPTCLPSWRLTWV